MCYVLRSTALLNPEVIEEHTPTMALEGFRSLLSRVEYAALVCWPPNASFAFPRWGTLFQVASPLPAGLPKHILLHAPAAPEEIRAAEAVLRFKLPPSYRRFLQMANGLSPRPDERSWIYGAGPRRVPRWDAVVLNQWLEGCQSYTEIAAAWRVFHGTYDYERIRDWEQGENTFLSDETILVPFAYTYETWCFDRTRPDAQGEYPVLFWDHETREASAAYPNFSQWFVGEIEPYLSDIK